MEVPVAKNAIAVSKQMVSAMTARVSVQVETFPPSPTSVQDIRAQSAEE